MDKRARLMAVGITCPSCGKSIKVPENVLGKKIRCTGCKEVFQAQADEDVVEVVDEVEEPARKPAKSAKPAPAKGAGKGKEAPAKGGKPAKGKGDEEDDDEANPY